MYTAFLILKMFPSLDQNLPITFFLLQFSQVISSAY